MSIFNTVKAHPFMIAAAIFIIGGAIIYANSGASSAAITVGDPTTTTQDATDLQNNQFQLTAQNNQIQGALQGQTEGDATSITLANIAAGVQYNANNLSAGVANAQIQEQATESTLVAQTQQKQIEAQTAQIGIASQTTIQTTQDLANVLMQQIKATTKIATTCHGLGCLF